MASTNIISKFEMHKSFPIKSDYLNNIIGTVSWYPLSGILVTPWYHNLIHWYGMGQNI